MRLQTTEARDVFDLRHLARLGKLPRGDVYGSQRGRCLYPPRAQNWASPPNSADHYSLLKDSPGNVARALHLPRPVR